MSAVGRASPSVLHRAISLLAAFARAALALLALTPPSVAETGPEPGPGADDGGAISSVETGRVAAELAAKPIPASRWVEGGPFRVVPSLPPLTENGERPEDLGFASAESLLAGVSLRANANAIAFSPDGSLRASGGNDGSVRLWDVPDLAPAGLLLGGIGGNWLCLDDRGTLRGGDDGTLLSRFGTRGSLESIPGRDWGPGTAPEVSTAQGSLSIGPGEPTDLTVRVRTTGPEPLYWLRLEAARLAAEWWPPPARS